MPDNSRLDELRRRVQQDPASIAFAALADEYRRAGLFEQAIETCRAGLVRHPAYLSARVTLGRALMEIGEYDEAKQHLEQVIRVAPDNLAAIRGLAEIHHRRGDSPDAYTAAASTADDRKPPAAPARIVAMPPRVISPPAASSAPAPDALVERTGAPEATQVPEAPPATGTLAGGAGVPLAPRVAAPNPETPRTESSAAPDRAAQAPERVRSAAPTAPRMDVVRERLEQLLAGIARARASRETGGSLTTR